MFTTTGALTLLLSGIVISSGGLMLAKLSSTEEVKEMMDLGLGYRASLFERFRVYFAQPEIALPWLLKSIGCLFMIAGLGVYGVVVF